MKKGHLVKWEKRTQNEPKRTQNEPNYKKAKINASAVITTNYEQRTMNYEIKNKPNQTQCLSAISVAGQRQKNSAAGSIRALAGVRKRLPG
jgi:hypothetical protein